jgi:hypothetical protein
MGPFEAVVLIFALAAFGLAVTASISIARDDSSDAAQKRKQWVFVWLLPLLGPIITLQLLRREPERSDGRYPLAPGEQAGDWHDLGQRGRSVRGKSEDPAETGGTVEVSLPD